MKIGRSIRIGTLGLLAGLTAAAWAGEGAYESGSVWEFSSIDITPGQFDRYIDHLRGPWRSVQEAGIKDGAIVSYHVFTVNHARQGEPDLVLAVEYRDYLSNAERKALHSKFEKALTMDSAQMNAAAAERESIRSLMGSIEMQELKLE